VAGGMFRKAALDKVSSPEQLDLMMQVTSPLGWLALVTVGVIIIVVGAWSVVGSIPDLIDGQGTLFRGERLAEVKAGMAGSIVRLAIHQNDHLAAGQVIAEIKRRGGSLEDARADELTIAKNREMMKSKAAEIGNYRSQRALQAQLVAQGLKPGNALLEWDQRVNAASGELASLEQQTRTLEARMSATVEVKTVDAGRVVEVLKSNGDMVGEGEALLRLEPEAGRDLGQAACGGQTHMILYVPSRDAGKVQVGQDVHVSPLDVKKEEFGYIVGRVATISRYPASPEDMKEKLKNEALVRSFAQESAVYESRVCLDADPANKFNGLKWSSGGPPKKVEPGAACRAQVVVDHRKPISYIIPMVKRTIGLE
jgi:HlyD family secretion protein